jgi:F-type H+-transporting ATPase subunit b
MIVLNFTLVVQLLLFLLFLYVTNKFVIRPLLVVMDARSAELEDDVAAAEADSKEAAQIDANVKERLVNVHQEEALRLRKARLDEYQKNREVLDEIKRRSDAAIDEYSKKMDQRIETERGNYATVLPVIIEAMDRQVNTEGFVS